MSGYEFEAFLKTLFKKMGYSVEQTKLSGDQGADLIVNKLGETLVIQAKRSNSKIGNKAIQEVVASINHYNAQRGMVITNNEFTPAAIELAHSNKIELVDRIELKNLFKEYF
ncbi:MAG: restriction endonuclease [Candidatus Omnitrophica bacterium]|nr:restriction endonuclease [Candidatus Omnitrophota bacterium]